MQRLGETEIARDRIMRKTELTKEVCPFCGKRKIVTITTKDFWEEHRGNSWTEEEREEEDCGCTFSRMLKDKAEIVPCCGNCVFNSSGFCKNKEMLDSVFRMFEPTTSMKIRDTSFSCQYHQLDMNIFKKIITVKTIQR